MLFPNCLQKLHNLILSRVPRSHIRQYEPTVGCLRGALHHKMPGVAALRFKADEYALALPFAGRRQSRFRHASAINYIVLRDNQPLSPNGSLEYA